MVSSFAPRSLTVPVLRATKPSSISVTPAKMYTAKKAGESAGQKSSATLARMRRMVMRFAMKNDQFSRALLSRFRACWMARGSLTLPMMRASSAGRSSSERGFTADRVLSPRVSL